jgi:hypothetical protein
MFKVSTPNTIKYYTIIIDEDQVHEKQTVSPTVRLKKKIRREVERRPLEHFVYDHDIQKWRTKTHFTE